MREKRRLIKILAIVFVFIVTCSMVKPITVKASKNLDEILDYTIKINPRTDGTLDITYNITWRVLDSTTEGPLEWVKIGAPNKHFEVMEGYSDNIKKIKSYEQGKFVRIDFKEKYEAGETIRFYYTIHQSRMYVIDKEQHLCRYSFTPGWFDDIKVKHTAILWNKKNIIEANTKNEYNEYMIWEAELDEGERINASIKYNLDVFTVSEDEQAEENDGIGIVGIIIIGVLIFIGIIIIIVLVSDDYDSGSGFGGGNIFISSCVRSSCVSSCACACACAAGGRAGCSKKDFYSTNLKTSELKDVIETIKID